MPRRLVLVAEVTSPSIVKLVGLRYGDISKPQNFLKILLTKRIIVEYGDVVRIFLQLFRCDRRSCRQVHIIRRLDRQGHGRPLHDTVPSKHGQIRQVHGCGHVCQRTIQ